MHSPESFLHAPGKLQMPALPGANAAPDKSNPFSGIRRAGQAKRAQNFEKFQGKDMGAPDASFDGSKFQNMGGQAKTQVGSMRQAKMKFS